MRKILSWTVAVLAGVLILFFMLAPAIIDKSSNTIAGTGSFPVSARAAALHKTLAVVDLHADPLLWQRQFEQPAGRGHVEDRKSVV